MADEWFRDDRWYGARYRESIGDTIHVIAGRILRDLAEDKESGALPHHSTAVVAVVGNTITVTLFVLPAPEGTPPFNADTARTRIRVIASRYDWRGKDNDNDRRFYLRYSVKSVRSSLEGAITGALLG